MEQQTETTLQDVRDALDSEDNIEITPDDADDCVCEVIPRGSLEILCGIDSSRLPALSAYLEEQGIRNTRTYSSIFVYK